MQASVTSDSTPTPPPRRSASQRAPPRARAPRLHPRRAAAPLTPSFRPALLTPTWPCCSTLIMRPLTDSRRHILILLASPSPHRPACIPAPCFQLGLRPLVLINQRRVLQAHHYPLRVLRRNRWFPTTGTLLQRRTQRHHLVIALQCRPSRPNRRITSSTHLPHLPGIPRIGRRILLGRLRPAIRPRRRPVLLRLLSAPVPSHPASRRRSRQEKRARTVCRHRNEGITVPVWCLFVRVRLYTVRLLYLCFIFHPMLCLVSRSLSPFFFTFLLLDLSNMRLSLLSSLPVLCFWACMYSCCHNYPWYYRV
jgi:hypothetical protein